MNSRNTSGQFRLTALAVAVAALVPLAHSGSRVVVADKVAYSAKSTSTASAEAAPNNRFIITYSDRAKSAKPTTAAMSTAASKAGVQIRPLRTLSTGADLILTDKALDATEAKLLMVELLKNPGILTVEPDIRLTRMFVPNDPLYAQQWHFRNGPGGANLEPAWDITRGEGIVVGVIDTGITPHSEFAGQVLPGYDFIADVDTAVDGDGRDADPNDPGDWHDGECDIFGIPEDSSWHGTHVSGTIAALTNNGVGVAGVSPGAKILPMRALGKCGGFLSDIADAITWGSGGTVAGIPANANPAEVLNLSLGGGGACSVALQTAIDGAVGRGTTVVVAAGNSGGDAANQQPASCNNVIAVSAVGPTGALASFSSFGPVVDVAGPGGTGAAPATDNVLSSLNLGLTNQAAEGYAWYAGTSMASPHVAGVAALIQAAAPSPRTPAQVKRIIENTAHANGGFPAGCSFAQPCGAGIVDATAAVRVANGTDPLPSDPPPPPPPPSATEIFNGDIITPINVPRNEWVRYELIVPNGAQNLLFATYGGTGDADMHVRFGNEPTTTAFDCRPFSAGNEETCFFPAPRSGRWFVFLRGFTAASGVSLFASFVDRNYPFKEATNVVQLSNHRTRVTLTWQNGKRDVDIFRNGTIFNTRRNRGTFTDNFRIVGSGTMTYRICNQGTTECSNEVVANYASTASGGSIGTTSIATRGGGTTARAELTALRSERGR